MSHRAAIFVLLLLSLTIWTACERVAKRATDPLAGRFEGTFAPQSGQPVKAEAWAIADENNKYRVAIVYPAAAAKTTRIELLGRGDGGEIAVLAKDWDRKPLDEPWSGTITKDALHIAAAGAKGGKAEMKRVEQKQSPTLGEKPPAGAVVLLPFEEGKTTNLDQWTNDEWPCEPDGSIQVYRGHNRTKQEFGSFKLHVEFYVPFLPTLPGQSRGTSGIYLHNRYEICIIDSFGMILGDHSCGAISGRQAPAVDVSVPPGQWQTFDIDFKAPQFDAANDAQVRARSSPCS